MAPRDRSIFPAEDMSSAAISSDAVNRVSAQSRGAGPLQGLRVIEVAGIGPGPYAGMLLADLGAEVTRVVRPGSDEAGGLDPTLRNRRSMTLDLKRPEALDVLLRLVEHSDVLLEGFRPGVAERLGFGPDVCCQRNPRLIYARITGWGQEGPLAKTAGHDINYIALTGMLHQIGTTSGKPVPPLNVIGDFGGGGLMVAFGILCAVHERSRTGKGQVVDTAMIDSVASFLAPIMGLRNQGLWRDATAGNFLSGAAHFYDTYETRDGKWVAIGAIEPQFHELLLRGLGLDPAEFSIGVGFQQKPYEELVHEIWPVLRRKLAAAIASHTRAELEKIFEGSDACFTPVLSMDEAKDHPHNVSRATFIEVDGVTQVSPVPRFSRSVPGTPRPPRPPGADTQAVLTELGYAEDQIKQLLSKGACG
jgi:alpha-methylacyl-CoA racemase